MAKISVLGPRKRRVVEDPEDMVDALLLPHPQPEPYDPAQEGTPWRALFTLKIDVISAEGIYQSTLENKVKETVRQIGATLCDETLDQ